MATLAAWGAAWLTCGTAAVVCLWRQYGAPDRWPIIIRIIVAWPLVLYDAAELYNETRD